MHGPRVGQAGPSDGVHERVRSAAVVFVGMMSRWRRQAAFVALCSPIPAMVVRHVAAPTFPLPAEILAAVIVRLDPIRALIWRPRPIAVVPHVS